MIRPALKNPIRELLTKEGPMTTTQIANRISCTSDGAGYAMRHAPGEFYVSGWTMNYKQIWSAGKGEDAPRPQRSPKEDPAKVREYKANGIERERTRLNKGYVTGARIWGI